MVCWAGYNPPYKTFKNLGSVGKFGYLTTKPGDYQKLVEKNIRELIAMKPLFICIFSFLVGAINMAAADSIKEEFKPQNPDVTGVVFDIYQGMIALNDMQFKINGKYIFCLKGRRYESDILPLILKYISKAEFNRLIPRNVDDLDPPIDAVVAFVLLKNFSCSSPIENRGRN